MYSIHTVPHSSIPYCIICDVTNTTIPVAALNSDYQRVLDDIIEQAVTALKATYLQIYKLPQMQNNLHKMPHKINPELVS